MLTPQTLVRVEHETLDYWTREVMNEYFIEIAQGKEIGHKLADLVDEKNNRLTYGQSPNGISIGY